MNEAILLLHPIYPLLADASDPDLLLQVLANRSSSPTVVNLPTVGDHTKEINCLGFRANADFPNFIIWELNVNHFRHLRDIPINFSAVFVPIIEPMTRGYTDDRNHFLMIAQAQRANLWATIDWLVKHVNKSIIIICMRNGVNGLDASELLDADLLNEFELVDFYVDDSHSFIRKIQSVLSIKGISDTD